MADRVASFGGSWTFIGIAVTGLVVWMIVNEESARPFDPYPFILMNLFLSLQAAYTAPVLMMSQNRLAARDRIDTWVQEAVAQGAVVLHGGKRPAGLPKGSFYEPTVLKNVTPAMRVN